jgi:undecaprenyl diphosphate synthase
MHRKGIHMGIIPDGSRRWARKNRYIRWDGRQSGEAMSKVVSHIFTNYPQVTELTIWGMSTENFHRPEKHKMLVFKLLERKIGELIEDDIIHRHEIRVNVVGTKLGNIPKSVRQISEKLMNATKEYKNKIFNICIGYGGRSEITEAAVKFAG